MKIDVQLEFPDEQAASVMRQLRNLPEMTIRFLKTDAQAEVIGQLHDKEALSEQEQHALLDQVVGSWQQEGEEDLLSQIYGARRDAPREVGL